MNITAGDLARFSIEAPRYTSYPTAAEFQTAVGASAYRDALRAAGDASAEPGGVLPPLSLYVHLPFCRAICHFCGCHALVARTTERIDRYRQALTQEMSTVAQALGRARPVGELHFGGGSPSLLEPDTFSGLMADLRARFAFASDVAISLEADPRTTDGARLQRYKELGVRRLSFGFQDFDDPDRVLGAKAEILQALDAVRCGPVPCQPLAGGRPVAFLVRFARLVAAQQLGEPFREAARFPGDLA